MVSQKDKSWGKKSCLGNGWFAHAVGLTKRVSGSTSTGNGGIGGRSYPEPLQGNLH